MRGKVFAVSSLVLVVPFLAAFGDPVSQVNQIVAFGDSLTDTGNAFIFTHGAVPGPGYAVGEYTNPPAPGGPHGLWIDQFAEKAGLPDPQPSLSPGGGTNYAFAGAETGTSAGDVSYQVNTLYLTGKSNVPSTDLYTFWAGANDILDAIKNLNNPITAAGAAADSIEANIKTLAGEGGKYFLWFNLPLLGDTPRLNGSIAAPFANAASLAFDTEWSKDMQALDKIPGIVLVGVDIETLFNQILNTPGHDGFNVTDIPQNIPGANPNNYLFWDGLHPTSAADTLIADLALTDFEKAVQPGTGTGVPEPASAALALVGLCGMLAATSKLKAKYGR